MSFISTTSKTIFWLKYAKSSLQLSQQKKKKEKKKKKHKSILKRKKEKRKYV